MTYKDSLFNHQRIKYISEIESKYKISEIEKENELLLKDNLIKENSLQAVNLKVQKQYTIVVALLICLIFSILTAIFWYRYNQKKKNTIKLLKKLNNEITNQKEKISHQARELKIVNTEMKNMNESLEFLVKERTKKIEEQNKKLRDYAFSNSHEVRAPLSNLLGLVNVSKIEGTTVADQKDIIEKIHLSALDLDSVITKVNNILEGERL